MNTRIISSEIKHQLLFISLISASDLPWFKIIFRKFEFF